MISRRIFLAGAISAAPAIAKQKLSIRIGLQIYSLRREAQKDLPATLATIRRFGFDEVEVSALYGHSAAEFRRLLDNNGLKATSMMAAYDRLAKEIRSVADDAHTLGAEYVVASTVPHSHKKMALDDIQHAAENLNGFGEKLAGSRLHCCYHIHGIEFEESADGTLFDTLAKSTNPKFANFEMDIFWIVYAYQDPVKLLHRYPGRFPLMHIKDIRKGIALGGSPGDVLEEDSVPLGKGIVDIPATLRAAKETGVRHYYVEDEAVDADRQIPESLRYLNNLRV
ncbi:MAG TPA: sugar phosphate isomerase/epimerase [Bryobacteraceae bacterium]|nr:sugar phosphate isomerase/epimerase [Bryobacteraceae bacterium]